MRPAPSSPVTPPVKRAGYFFPVLKRQKSSGDDSCDTNSIGVNSTTSAERKSPKTGKAFCPVFDLFQRSGEMQGKPPRPSAKTGRSANPASAPNDAGSAGMSEQQINKIEAQLIERIARGDRRAFEELFNVYGKRIFRYAVRMVNDVTKAEEITNDVMIEVWKSASRFEHRSSVSTWIIGITRHRALNAIRGKQLDTVQMENAPEPEDISHNAEQVQDRRSLHKVIRQQLIKLSPEHRDVIELTFFHGHSYKEIAELTGCPENTVKTRMFHAKKQLEPLFKAAGLEQYVKELTA